MRAKYGVYLVIATVVAHSSAANLHADEMEKILEAWKAHQAKVQTGRFAWDVTLTLPKNTLPIDGGATLYGPAEDAVITNHHSICFKGSHLKCQTMAQVWYANKAIFLPRASISANNDKENKEVSNRVANDIPPSGTIQKTKKHVEAGLLVVLPILINYRPLDPELGQMDKAKCTLSNDSALIDGERCVIVEQQEASMKTCVFLAPKHDYAVMRYLHTYGGKTGFQCDIHYSQDGANGWVPHAWESTSFRVDSMQMMEHATARVVEYRINCPLDESEFDFDFPAGAKIYDLRDGTRFIVLPGGKRRYIMDEEIRRGANDGQLMASDPGMAALSTNSTWGWRGLGTRMALAIGVLSGAAAMLWRKELAALGVRRKPWIGKV
jgi:hypothetical protein